MLAESVVLELCRSGGLDKNIEFVKGALQARRDALVEALNEQIPEAEFVVPGGGYFLWLDLAEGTDTTALLAEAKGEGVAFVAGPDFMIEGGTNSLRLSFASVPPERIAEGVARIARALRAASAPARPPSSLGAPASEFTDPPRRAVRVEGGKRNPRPRRNDMAVANKASALARVASDPVSRRKLLALTGGSAALAAFLAACGRRQRHDDDDRAAVPRRPAPRSSARATSASSTTPSRSSTWRPPSTPTSSRAASSRAPTWRRSASSAARRPNTSPP